MVEIPTQRRAPTRPRGATSLRPPWVRIQMANHAATLRKLILNYWVASIALFHIFASLLISPSLSGSTSLETIGATFSGAF